MHLDQARVEHLVCHLANRHSCPLEHSHQGALDVGVDGGQQNGPCLPYGTL